MTTTNPHSFRKEWKIHLFATAFLFFSKEQEEKAGHVTVCGPAVRVLGVL